MPDKNLLYFAHDSFPLSAPALQSASLKPDFQYYEISYARDLSAVLDRSKYAFSASELSAIGLIGKVYLSVIQKFLQTATDSFTHLDHYLPHTLGEKPAKSALSEALSQFPTSLSYLNPGQKKVYHLGSSGKALPRHSFYFSLILILVAENNPALRSKDGLFTDPFLRDSENFKNLKYAINDFFKDQPDFNDKGLSLIDQLLEPGRLYPKSIFDQLQFISKHWGEYLDPELLRSLIIGLDQLKEEDMPGSQKAKIIQDPLGYLGESEALGAELINFSPDKDWMPQVILQAKNVFVWLDQLSQEYQRPISKLDQIPDEELSKLSLRGINALWLIGLWERSPASQKIKQLCGNPEAVSSAYSLFDYTISGSLGGDDAYQHLSSTAAKFKIRLAADMVPNHMGIDSRWMIDHPEWFLSLDNPPFPGYTFEGANLSSDPATNIYLEDHYYDRTDASVVFKRQDKRSGETRYIYHGNDGTSMPWNDTAQLDYLNPEVREAVIQAILHVAKKFPIIRFDAAMTLSKKHYQRLWFPQPGSGGAIPTRSDFSLSKTQFDTYMPTEFWRELVDRIAEEVPDTLLLAEAFWMMEGYFVRSLGMHRVYNSAFMHMLRDEDNKKYRDLLVSTLEYDPQILKRYVNFMNNPDEETALSQFGPGGKYFGTCLIMSTLPGLPMFGHGQIEGLAEKYGMEYKKAYYNESPDPAFIERHHKEIFPLLHKRYLFSDVEHFNLYDLTRKDGTADNNVFVFSNRAGDEQALIIFHNKWGDTRGWISNSTPINGVSIDFLSGLGISGADGDYLTFRDQISGLEYIRSINELSANGLFLDLGAYNYHAFIDFFLVTDQDGSYAALNQSLDGAGTVDLHQKKLELRLSPLIEPILALCSLWKEALFSQKELLGKLSLSTKNRILDNSAASGDSFYSVFSTLFPDQLFGLETQLISFRDRISQITSLLNNPLLAELSPDIRLLLPWVFLADISSLIKNEDLDIVLSLLSDPLSDLEIPGPNGREFLIHDLTLAIKLAPSLASTPLDLLKLADLWLTNLNTRKYINIHEFEEVEWFHKESMESLIRISFNLLFIEFCFEDDMDVPSITAEELIEQYSKAVSALAKSDYRADNFMRILAKNVSGE